MKTIELSVHWQVDPITGDIVNPDGDYKYGFPNCLQQHGRSVLLEIQPKIFVGMVDHEEEGAYLGKFEGEPSDVARGLVANFRNSIKTWNKACPERSADPAQLYVLLRNFPADGGLELGAPKELVCWFNPMIGLATSDTPTAS